MKEQEVIRVVGVCDVKLKIENSVFPLAKVGFVCDNWCKEVCRRIKKTTIRDFKDIVNLNSENFGIEGGKKYAVTVSVKKLPFSIFCDMSFIKL